MSTLIGTYFNGQLKLDSPFKTEKPVRVRVIVDDNETTELKLSDFSFSQTREMLKNCNTLFSDDVIEERRKAI
jgi:hypothetical protein